MPGTVVNQTHLVPPPWSLQSSKYLSPHYTVSSLGRRIVCTLDAYHSLCHTVATCSGMFTE